MNDVEEIRRYYDAILPYYDDSLADRGDLPFWESMATRWGSTRILELGCGTGRVTAVLSRHSPVTAVDLLVEMLAHAVRRVPAARFVAADLRQFAFRELFDLIVLADDPMAHLISNDDRRRVMQLIADHLAPGGRLVMEGLYRQPGSSVSRRDDRGKFTVEETWITTDDPAVWNARYRYRTGDSIVDVASVMRSWSPAEVAGLAALSLQVENVWGDFDERPFRDDSKRIIVAGRRAPRSRTAAVARGSTEDRL